MATLAGTPKPPSGHSALATNPDYEITVEAEPKRMRVVFNGETIADSNKTVLLHETRLPDTHYFPRQDVAMDFLNSTDHHTFCPYKGNASYWSIVAGGETMKIPIAGGENVRGADEFRGIIDEGVFDVIQPDACKWGGVTGCLRVAKWALEAGLRYCPHYLGGGIGLVASAHILAAAGGNGLLEIDVNPNPLREALAQPFPKISGGRFILPAGSGLGVEPDLDAAKPWLTERHDIKA
jgi:uncharacterized protein (DUF427 family)